jgi:O-antigen/teichoic acid export membrane protein
MDRGKTIALNAASRWTGEIASKGIWFLFAVILARRLGSSGFGYFNYAFSFGSLLVVLTDLGTNIQIVKSISKDEGITGSYLTNVIALKLVLSAVVLVIVVAYALLASRFPGVLVLFSISLLIGAFLDPLNSVFRAYRKMAYETLVMLLWRIIIVGTSLIGIYTLGFDLLGISVCFIVASVVALLVSLRISRYAVREKIFSFDRIHSGGWGKILKDSLAPGALLFAFTLFFKLNIILLEMFSNSDQVGWYSAPYKLIEAGFFISSFFVASIFPYFCRDGERHRISDKANILFKKAFLFLFVTATVISVGLWAFSYEIILFIYGESYLPAVTILKTVAWLPILIYLNELFLFFFLSIDKQNKLIIYLTIPISVYLLSCGILIPKWSAAGAAWSLLLTEIVLFAVNVVLFGSLRRASV